MDGVVSVPALRDGDTVEKRRRVDDADCPDVVGEEKAAEIGPSFSQVALLVRCKVGA